MGRVPQKDFRQQVYCGLFPPAETELFHTGRRLRYRLSDRLFLSERGFRITGIDSSAKMIEKAASLKLKNTEYHVAELFGFRTEEKFDAIIAFDCLWHICHDNQKYIYGTIASLIKKGGYFIFTHGKKDGEIYGEMMGQTFYYSALDAEEVKKILISEGFEIISFTENYKERTTGDRELLVEARKL